MIDQNWTSTSTVAFTPMQAAIVAIPGEASPLNSSTGDARTDWMQRIDDLLKIRKLSDDWDGEGSQAPGPALVDGAITLATYLHETKNWYAPDRAIAGVNGTVYFEWHTPQGYCEIEVTSPLEAEYRWVPKGADTAEVVRFFRRW